MFPELGLILTLTCGKQKGEAALVEVPELLSRAITRTASQYHRSEDSTGSIELPMDVEATEAEGFALPSCLGPQSEIEVRVEPRRQSEMDFDT